MTPSACPVLTTPRCVLRPFTEADLPAFAAYRSDPEIARYQSWDTPYSIAQAAALLASVQATPFDTPDTWVQIALADRETGALLGDCALHFLADGRQVELGFTLARAHQGKGLAREAVTALLDHVFGPLGKHRVSALTDARNEASIALLTRLGFRREAHYLQNAYFKGSWCDEMLFACLATEWHAARPPA
ncbi:MAG: GNAT family protein [Polyangiaceae bacterium]